MLPKDFKCDFPGLEEALTLPPSISVRFNVRKYYNDSFKREQKVPWCSSGIYLDERIPFTFDPAMHQGRYYVQDASSMIYSYILTLLTAGKGPIRYLDACAAPGGKTTAAIDALPDGSFVVANEYVAARAEVLRENLVKWGYPFIMVTKGDTAKFRKLPDEFDIIAADVPCSGEGMFRKDADAVAQWSESLVRECAARQREIVRNLWDALRPGGYFIYSTCTFNRSENEDVIDFMVNEMEAEPVNFDFPAEWRIVERDNCYHFLPGKVRGEGLTVAVVRKPGSYIPKPCKRDKTVKTDAVASACRKWLSVPDDFVVSLQGDCVKAIPAAVDAGRVREVLDVIYEGVELGRVKGRDIIPSQSLALSTAISHDAFPLHEVDYATAIAYLRREAVAVEGAPVGIVMLTYKGAPLGFVKNLGRRANNLYPQQWRIMSSHLPDTPPDLFC